MSKAFNGTRLRELRLAANVSQARVANAVGVTVPNYSNWERGRQVPSARYLSDLVEVIDCDYGDLFTA